MPKKENIKGYSVHFRAFSLYLKCDYADCRKAMKAHFRTFPDPAKAVNLDKKIDQWWDEDRKPQADQVRIIQSFFRHLAQEANKKWQDDWLEKPLKAIFEPNVQKAIEKVEEPYAVGRIFRQCYVQRHNNGLLQKVIEKYCHRCFYIYRFHTGSNSLVRDLLRFHGHDDEKIFCTMYQYTSHYSDRWKNVKTFKGNVFFNNASLDISLVTDVYDQEQGPQFANLVCPRFFENTARLGLLMALTDQTHHPAAATILICTTDIPNPIDIGKIQSYVKEVTKQDVENYQDIVDAIFGKRVIVEQPEKGTMIVKTYLGKNK